MPGLIDFIINHVVMNISVVRDAAAQHNGQCTWRFSQCVNPVRSLIAKNEVTKKGICEILSAKWVCEGHHGRSMRDWLTTGPGGALDLAKLSLLAQVFGTGYGQQTTTTEAWMRANGVPPRDRVGDDVGGAPGAGVKFDVEDDLLGDFRRKVNNNRINKPLFALMDIEADNLILGHMGHAMAVMAEPINAASFRYFDPNYGEFRFNNWNGFKDWFLYAFRKSHYRTYMGRGYRLRYF
jgi:hypothetical protein